MNQTTNQSSIQPKNQQRTNQTTKGYKYLLKCKIGFHSNVGNWKMYQDKGLRESGHQKHMLFFFMQYLSNFQAIFKDYMNKPSIFWVWKSSVSSINYNTIPGTWQGRTDGNLKVLIPKFPGSK